MSTTFPPSPPLYSLVAWPPEALDTWLRRTQERLNVRAFGVPHLNLRAPFQTDLRTPELVAAFREVLRGEGPFEVRVKGWKRVPHVIFLECELDARLANLHARALSVGPSSRAPHDGERYIPHLTLALGLLPWAEDEVWEQVRDLMPPVQAFTVNVLSLTREERGEVQELHTFPLDGGQAGERAVVGTGEAHF
ncbi:RNA ligase of LigT family [Deinococcus aerius]|uniref:RNA ligase of LigT family n=1 Tax=Deinococcus aerius TaxID=200253 RepID=A0A2I9D5D4_9DEIO|nr:2'-5' RNA ligase family protein [Deinococcus aerius]GBF05550.1 RNA ligase of LigT family [Deinococcus aerius]